MRVGLAQEAQRHQYADYRRRLNAQSVLDYYSAENSYEIAGSEGTTEVIHSCLLDRVEEHHTNGDQNPSAACNLDRKAYTCYSGYWGGDLFHLIMKMEGKHSLDEIIPILGQFLDGSTQDQETFTAEIARLFSPDSGVYHYEPPRYSDRILAPWAWVHPYLVERGIDVETASRLHLGWDEAENRITIPHFVDGSLVGWQKRAIPDRPGQWPGTSEQMPKYRSTSGFPKSDTLYGYDRATGGRVIVVESPFSVAKAEALGVKGVVATFGAKVSRRQIALLKERFYQVVIWFDGDPAGHAGERILARSLYRHVNEVLVVDAEPGKDLADYTTAESVEAKIAEATPVYLKLAEWDREARRYG